MSSSGGGAVDETVERAQLETMIKLKKAHREQLETLDARYQAAVARRNALAAEVDQLRSEVELHAAAAAGPGGTGGGKAADEATASAGPGPSSSAGGGGGSRRGSGAGANPPTVTTRRSWSKRSQQQQPQQLANDHEIVADESGAMSIDGMTLTDEQIADALANLLDFSATKSNMRSAEK